MSGEDVYTDPCPDTSPTGGDVRQRLVDIARPFAGLSYRPETRDAYVELLFAGEDPHRASEMARTMSSCGLFVRACWRLYGLKDDRLRAPYHVGMVMADLHAMAHEAGAWRPASRGGSPAGARRPSTAWCAAMRAPSAGRSTSRW